MQRQTTANWLSPGVWPFIQLTLSPRCPAMCWARGSREGAVQLRGDPFAQAALPGPWGLSPKQGTRAPAPHLHCPPSPSLCHQKSSIDPGLK